MACRRMHRVHSILNQTARYCGLLLLNSDRYTNSDARVLSTEYSVFSIQYSVLSFLKLRHQRRVSVARCRLDAFVAGGARGVLLAEGVQRIGVAQPAVAFVIVQREIGGQFHFGFVQQAGFEQLVGETEAGERIRRLLGSHCAHRGEAIDHDGKRAGERWRDAKRVL